MMSEASSGAVDLGAGREVVNVVARFKQVNPDEACTRSGKNTSFSRAEARVKKCVGCRRQL